MDKLRYLAATATTHDGGVTKIEYLREHAIFGYYTQRGRAKEIASITIIDSRCILGFSMWILKMKILCLWRNLGLATPTEISRFGLATLE